MKYLLFCIFFLLTSCTETTDKIVSQSQSQGWQWQILPSGRFDIQTALSAKGVGDTLWIYIEGDGLAYLRPDQPSFDPTPSDPVALRLALAHQGNEHIAYLARACQYIGATNGRGCKDEYWTTARYAPEVIESASKAIDSLKEQTHTSHIVLVGYSGGGALAILLAAKRQDISGIITIASNLDLSYWIKRDHLTPLSGSLDPASFANQTALVPQIHFTGTLDDVVGDDVARSYMLHLPQNNLAQIVSISGFTHICCWVEKWPEMLNDIRQKNGFVSQ